MTVTGSAPAPPPAHPDVEILDAETGFARHLQVDIVRFRHRRFAGGWSGERVFDVVRRGAAAAVLLYDPERDSVVLIEQFRIAALYAGRSPWLIEAVAGLIDIGRDAGTGRPARGEGGSQSRSPGPARADPNLPAGKRQLRRSRPSVLRPGRQPRRRRASTGSQRSRRTFASSSRPSPKSRRCSMAGRSTAPTR